MLFGFDEVKSADQVEEGQQCLRESTARLYKLWIDDSDLEIQQDSSLRRDMAQKIREVFKVSFLVQVAGSTNVSLNFECQSCMLQRGVIIKASFYQC